MVFVWGEKIGEWIIGHWFGFVWNVFFITIGTVLLILPVWAKGVKKMVQKVPAKKGTLFVWKYVDKVAILLVEGR